MAFRPFAKIAALMPRGGAQMQVAVPKRKEFGDEGDEGDAAHEAAMQRFSLHSFGSSHVQLRTSDRRLCEVGSMGDWLEQSGYDLKNRARGPCVWTLEARKED